MSLGNQIQVICRLTVDYAFREAFTQSPGETLKQYGYTLSPNEVQIVEHTAELFARHPEMGNNLDASVRRPCRTHFPATFVHAEAELAAEDIDLAEDFVRSPQFWSEGQTWSAHSGSLSWQEKAQLREKYNYLLDCFYSYIKTSIEKVMLTRPYLPDLVQYEYDCYKLPQRLYPSTTGEDQAASQLPSDPLRLYPRATSAAIVRTYSYPVTTIKADPESVTSAAGLQPQQTSILFGYGGASFVKLNLTPSAKAIWSRCDGRISVGELADSLPQKQAVLQFLQRLFEYHLIQAHPESA